MTRKPTYSQYTWYKRAVAKAGMSAEGHEAICRARLWCEIEMARAKCRKLLTAKGLI